MGRSCVASNIGVLPLDMEALYSGESHLLDYPSISGQFYKSDTAAIGVMESRTAELFILTRLGSQIGIR